MRSKEQQREQQQQQQEEAEHDDEAALALVDVTEGSSEHAAQLYDRVWRFGRNWKRIRKHYPFFVKYKDSALAEYVDAHED